MVTTRKVKTMQGDNRGEKTLDGVTTCTICLLQLNEGVTTHVVQERFSHWTD